MRDHKTSFTEGNFRLSEVGFWASCSHTTKTFLRLTFLSFLLCTFLPPSLVSSKLWCSFPLWTRLHLLPHFPTHPSFAWWIFHRPVETDLLLSHPLSFYSQKVFVHSVPITFRDDSVRAPGEKHLRRPEASKESISHEEKWRCVFI